MFNEKADAKIVNPAESEDQKKTIIVKRMAMTFNDS